MKNNLFINEKRSHDSAKKHVSGYANYTDDIDEPNGTLYGAVGWSKEAHALIKKIDPEVNLHFMHTIKSKESISSAYFDYGVRSFSLDNKDELRKILVATNQAKDLKLFVRIAISNEHAEIDLSRKFGANPSEALGLVRLCKEHSKKIGISFHVGSQCMHKISYSKGIQEVGNIIKKT